MLVIVASASFVIMPVVAVFAVIIFLILIFKFVAEDERLVIFRLGRCLGQRGPGLVPIIPVVDRPIRVDLREQNLEIPNQAAMTKNKASVGVHLLIGWKVIDPVKSVMKVTNVAAGLQRTAATALRTVIGDLPRDEILAKREQINDLLRTKMEEMTEPWGVKLTLVKIREILL